MSDETPDKYHLDLQTPDKPRGQKHSVICPELFAGEPLEGSGFESEIPEPGFVWSDQQ